MKVAFIGNMNNNHFSMMRYFHDLGIEAHLYLFANELPHFKPECDSWNLSAYQKFIHQTDIVNGDLKQFFKLSKRKLRSLFVGYDYYIGCGFSPAYFAKAKLKLDIFIPYCVGIEFTFRIIKNGAFDSIKEKVVEYFQVSGIKQSVKFIATLDKETAEKALSLKIPVLKLGIPMVYNEKLNSDFQFSPLVENIIRKLSNYDFIAFSHVSHFPPNTRSYFDKRNDIFIEGFSHFLRLNKGNINPVLVLLEYGDYVYGSKLLIKKLGIEENVIWLPLMKRKELMKILELVTVGGGEFGGLFWGGTGWEFLCKGVPFFQFMETDPKTFKRDTNMEIPNFFNLNSPIEIGKRMHQLVIDNNSKEIGNSLKEWFNKYSGISIANKYVEVLKSL